MQKPDFLNIAGEGPNIAEIFAMTLPDPNGGNWNGLGGHSFTQGAGKATGDGWIYNRLSSTQLHYKTHRSQNDHNTASRTIIVRAA
jgi:hypothetical protein